MSIRQLAIVVLLLTLPGCSKYSFYDLAPAPNLYVHHGQNPYPAVPESLRTTEAPVIYVTDREPEKLTPAQTAAGYQTAYGYRRSRSTAFGIINVDLGPGMTWDQLAATSTEHDRAKPIRLVCKDTRELGRFPPTPDGIVIEDGMAKLRDGISKERLQAENQFRALMAERLAQASTHDAYIFIHGYNSEFEWPAYVIAQMWHYMGRPGVPIAYSWPAGSPGLLRGYQYDRESGEFTIFHLKRFLLLLGSVPGLERVCIVAHSRGTDVATSALRELTLELGGWQEARRALKLSILVLAAADLDFEVVNQRLVAEEFLLVPDRTVFYVHKEDEALGLADWMFASNARMGQLGPDAVKPEGKIVLHQAKRLEIVDARISTPEMFSHSYFYAHPAACSDLILVLRDGRAAGAENGRPLKRDPSGFWILDNQYPETTPAGSSPAPQAPDGQ